MFKLLGSRQKTQEGVRKSRDTWFGRVRGLFQRARLDGELWDEVEELLISADVGVATTERLLERVRGRVREEGISDAPAAMQVLKEEMVAILRNLGVTRSFLIVLLQHEAGLWRCTRNIPGAAMLTYRELNAYEMIRPSRVIFTLAAIERFLGEVPGANPSAEPAREAGAREDGETEAWQGRT